MSVQLETERLVLRRPRLDDVDALAPLYADPEVTRYIGSGRTLERDEVADAVTRMIDRWEADGFGYLLAERHEDGRLVGRIGLLAWDAVTWTPTTLREASGATEIEVGWKLAREFWGCGYATEAARAAVAWAFATLDVPRLISLIHPENTRSIRVAEKLGERYQRDVVTAGGGTARLYALERRA